MIEQDRTEALRSALGEARDRQAALCIVGGESKRFYGRTPAGEPFSVRGHCGIIDYQPTELVVTARAGTPMSLLQQALAEQGQTLACESPQYSDRATVGGTVATNASGPGRPFLGSVRDFVLGLRLLTGQGQVLSFGGQVIKNVAGYDLSRLSCGALGTLGVILEVSFKVLPLAETEQTLRLPMDAEAAIAFMNRTAGSPYPVTAMCFDGEAVHLRLSGAGEAVTAARCSLGGETLDHGRGWWASLREFEHPFFDTEDPLWRLSMRSGHPPDSRLQGEWLIDWAGGQRWLRSAEPAERIRSLARESGGHAALFRGGNRDGEVFQPLDPVLMRLHRRIKKAMDPDGLLNPGRLYSDL